MRHFTLIVISLFIVACGDEVAKIEEPVENATTQVSTPTTVSESAGLKPRKSRASAA